MQGLSPQRRQQNPPGGTVPTKVASGSTRIRRPSVTLPPARIDERVRGVRTSPFSGALLLAAGRPVSVSTPSFHALSARACFQSSTAMTLCCHRLFRSLIWLLTVPASFAANHYVAPSGSDSNAGTIDAPFASVQRAPEAARPGDTVFIRGGTYMMNESQIVKHEGPYAYVQLLHKNGEPGNRINYWAYPGEQPTFDFSQR